VKQDGVDDRLVVERDVRDRSRHGEHDVEVGNWQQFGLACFEPLGACQTLALRAVPIAAGVVRATNEPAIGAAFDMTAQCWRPTCLDRRHDAALGAAHMIRMGLPVRWTVVAEDIRHLQRRSHRGVSGGRRDRSACGVSCGLQTIQRAGSGAHLAGGEAQIFCRGVETAMTKQKPGWCADRCRPRGDGRQRRGATRAA
jgi:hypothetical protein